MDRSASRLFRQQASVVGSLTPRRPFLRISKTALSGDRNIRVPTTTPILGTIVVIKSCWLTMLGKRSKQPSVCSLLACASDHTGATHPLNIYAVSRDRRHMCRGELSKFPVNGRNLVRKFRSCCNPNSKFQQPVCSESEVFKSYAGKPMSSSSSAEEGAHCERHYI